MPLLSFSDVIRLNRFKNRLRSAQNNKASLRMKVFQTLKEHIEFLTGYNSQSFQTTQRWNIRMFVYFNLISTFCVSTLAFTLFKAKTFQEYADSFYLSTTSLCGCTIPGILIWNIAKFYKFCENIDDAIQKRVQMNPSSSAVFTEVIERIEKLTKIFRLSLNCTVGFLMIPQIIIIFYEHFTSGLEADDYKLPFLVSLPFNYSTPVRYSAVFAVQYVQVCSFLNSTVVTLSLFLGACFLIITLINEVKKELRSLSEMNETAETPGEIKKKFDEFIQFHAETKQFVSEFNDYFGPSLFLYFLWGLVTVCGTLIMIQMQISQDIINWTVLLSICWELFWTFATMFVLCYFGEEVITAFEEMCDEIYQCDWHLFPHEVQRILPTVMTVAQDPVYIESFGGVQCTRDTFKRIVNSGYSYYQVLHNMN